MKLENESHKTGKRIATLRQLVDRRQNFSQYYPLDGEEIWRAKLLNDTTIVWTWLFFKYFYNLNFYDLNFL